MRIGVLTGGGDCPGLNAVIRSVTKSLIHRAGAEVVGIEQGFLGLIERRVRPLDLRSVAGIMASGGTILGTHNKANPFAWFGAGSADVSAQVVAYVRELEREDHIVSFRLTIPDRPGVLGVIATRLGELSANILEVDHKRLFLDVPAKGARLDVTVETRDRAHAEEILAALAADGYQPLRIEAGDAME